MTLQKDAVMDANPAIASSPDCILLAKREENVVEGGKWHLPGGRVLSGETLEETLKRVAFAKTGLRIALRYPTLRESLVGLYDDPQRDSRQHVVGLAFLCKVSSGKANPGGKVADLGTFSIQETENLDIAFDHREMVKDAFEILQVRG